MNQVFIHVEQDGNGSFVGSSDYNVVAVDNYEDDIEFSVLDAPDFLSRPPHEIVASLADRNNYLVDLLQAAVENSTPIYLNNCEINRQHYVDCRAAVIPKP